MDLAVKVPGGMITVDRRFSKNQWFWGTHSRMRDSCCSVDGYSYMHTVYYRCYSNSLGENYCDYFDGDSLSVEGSFKCVSKDEFSYARVSPGVYKQGPYTVERNQNCSMGLETWGERECANNGGTWDDCNEVKYRWSDTQGRWGV